ncbi:hypothetical protein HDU76_000063 [Blyttiomyces sp. JEL0837]|nr:hypothetical protein HDU76_000063 [Blyttiomyces sp. JEL0837]
MSMAAANPHAHPYFGVRHLGKAFPGPPLNAQGRNQRPSTPNTSTRPRSANGPNTRPSTSPSRHPTASTPSGTRGGSNQNQRGRSTGNGTGSVPPTTGRSQVEEEYIRNLQQQVYLLELESRYMRNGGVDASAGGPSATSAAATSNHMQMPPEISQGSAPLSDAIKGLKFKYVELQEKHKHELQKHEVTLDQLKTEHHAQSLIIDTLEREMEEMRNDVRSMKEQQATEKDKLYGELIAARKKSEIVSAEHARLEKVHSRLLMEKQQLAGTSMHAQDDARKYREQVDELLQLNASLKVRIEELQKEHSLLTSKLDDYNARSLDHEIQSQKTHLEDLRRENVSLIATTEQAQTRAKQEEHLRLRIAQDCEMLVKSNTEMKAELEEVQRRLRKEFQSREQRLNKKKEQIREAEEVREELARLRDEFALQKVALDTKDRKLHDLKAQTISLEKTLNTALETRNMLEERVDELESRVRAQESDLIQIGQDKSLLVDDVAELRNTTEIKSMKMKNLLKENEELHSQLEKFMREMEARKEFGNLIGEIESTGENYLHLMRNMRSFLHHPRERAGTAREVEEIISDGIPVHSSSSSGN